MKYRHIIWDWNGTLLNDLWLSVEAINGVLEKYALRAISVEEYLRLFDFPVIDFYKAIGFDFERHPFEKVGAEFIDVYNSRRHECGLHDGARDFLKTAQNAGFTQSVLSAYEKSFLDSIISHHNISGYFSKISGLGDIYAASKVELGKAHVESLGLDKSEIVMIGDTVHDLHVARACGISCILKAQGHHPKNRLSSNGAQVVETFCELFALLV